MRAVNVFVTSNHQRWCRSLLFDPTTDAEDVPVRVPDVHLANVPGHVGWRPGDLQPFLEALPVDGVDIIDPDRHPHAVFRGVVAVGAERPLERALAPTALAVQAEEDLAVSRADASEVWWR